MDEKSLEKYFKKQKGRKPKRLNDFYDKLCKYHKKYCPDLRFGQMIINFEYAYKQAYNFDIFYIEEDRMIKLLKEYLKTGKIVKE